MARTKGALSALGREREERILEALKAGGLRTAQLAREMGEVGEGTERTDYRRTLASLEKACKRAAGRVPRAMAS